MKIDIDLLSDIYLAAKEEQDKTRTRITAMEQLAKKLASDANGQLDKLNLGNRWHVEAVRRTICAPGISPWYLQIEGDDNGMWHLYSQNSTVEIFSKDLDACAIPFLHKLVELAGQND
ncbi:MAG TPA: hypothetical protein VGK87_12160 [Anaerolineae bacterium]|jgi:hypothetical protein